MTEIINTFVHSFWFWAACYFIGGCLTYYLIHRFELLPKCDIEEGGDVLLSCLWIFPVIFDIIPFIFSLLGRFLRYLATADEIDKDNLKK